MAGGSGTAVVDMLRSTGRESGVGISRWGGGEGVGEGRRGGYHSDSGRGRGEEHIMHEGEIEEGVFWRAADGIFEFAPPPPPWCFFLFC